MANRAIQFTDEEKHLISEQMQGLKSALLRAEHYGYYSDNAAATEEIAQDLQIIQNVNHKLMTSTF